MERSSRVALAPPQRVMPGADPSSYRRSTVSTPGIAPLGDQDGGPPGPSHHPMAGPAIGRLPFGANRPATMAMASAARGDAPPCLLPDLDSGEAAVPPPSTSAALTAGDERFAALAEVLTAALIGPAHALGHALADDGVGWCPTYSFRSRVEAFAALDGAEESLAVHHFQVDQLWWLDPIAVATWRLVARVDVPLLVADDLLVEPSDRPVLLDGVTIAEVATDRVTSTRTTFDEAALLEQVLLRPAGMPTG